MPTVSAIIPFYNEGERVVEVLKEIVKIKSLSKVICVDDGSNDNSSFLIKKSTVFKKNKNKILLISFKKNQGKAEAVFAGLKNTNSDYVFILDADLKNLKAEDFKKGIKKIFTNKKIDMIILRRVFASLESSWFRADTIFSGERILKKDDLFEIFSTLKPKGYQLEIAINTYMIKNHKNVYWMPSSAINVFKRTKIGLIKGQIKELIMHHQMMKFAGFFNYIYQVMFFAKEELKD